MLDKQIWNQNQIAQHSLDIRQFIDFRSSILPNGTRIVEAYNSSGLTFTLLPDRGLDIWTANYNGIPLTWISPGSPHPPDFGLGWLQQFNGGLLTTCGLTHAGPPEKDDISGEQRDIHGRYSRLRAGELSTTSEWQSSEKYTRVLAATITETRLFGEQLQLQREYRLTLGDPAVEIVDTVTNLSDTPSPLMLVYHFNMGYPLIRDGAVLTAASRVYPRDEAARRGMDTWAAYSVAQPNYAEQVFFHQVYTDGEGYSQAIIGSSELALAFRWDTSTLPYLTQWKNVRQGIYVCGVEPGNCIPEGQNAARKKDRLKYLAPGESKRFMCQFRILSGEQSVQAGHKIIALLNDGGTLAAGCNLSDFA